MKRLGTPAEGAAAIAFLLSDDAGFITGQVLGFLRQGNDRTAIILLCVVLAARRRNAGARPDAATAAAHRSKPGPSSAGRAGDLGRRLAVVAPKAGTGAGGRARGPGAIRNRLPRRHL
ncbi:hypothetical protein G6F24_017810 [Rhizopus arrhizus]|nr:hypothetical protein G6F24_017810 [Rhizopus arrhizus]